jgi:hypothetical protein
MGRRSIVLLLTVAVLLQPAFASVCMAQCPMSVQATSAPLAMGAHSGHQHHHTAAMTDHSTSVLSSGACNKKIDLRSSAVMPPAISLASVTSDTSNYLPIDVSAPPLRVIERVAPSSSPIVVPLRI